MIIHRFSLPHLYISLWEGWEYVLFERREGERDNTHLLLTYLGLWSAGGLTDIVLVQVEEHINQQCRNYEVCKWKMKTARDLITWFDATTKAFLVRVRMFNGAEFTFVF